MTISDISVVIPAFNSEKFIAAALSSVAAQGLCPREVIVVDDGSSDSTFEVASDWVRQGSRSYPVHIYRQTNQGLPATRNFAIRHAVGKWIALLDSDDIWEAFHLEELAEAARQAPDAVAAYGAGRLLVDGVVSDSLYDDFWDNPSRQYGIRIPESHYWTIGRIVMPRLMRGNFIKPSSLMMLRSAMFQVGLFNESFRVAEDRELLLRLIRMGRFVYSEKAITQYRWHEDNISHVKNSVRNLEFGLKVLQLVRCNIDKELTHTEMDACDAEIDKATRSYMHLRARDGLRAYKDGVAFLVDLFGARSLASVFRFRHLARALVA